MQADSEQIMLLITKTRNAFALAILVTAAIIVVMVSNLDW